MSLSDDVILFILYKRTLNVLTLGDSFLCTTSFSGSLSMHLSKFSTEQALSLSSIHEMEELCRVHACQRLFQALKIWMPPAWVPRNAQAFMFNNFPQLAFHSPPIPTPQSELCSILICVLHSAIANEVLSRPDANKRRCQPTLDRLPTRPTKNFNLLSCL